jgi:hypothetical protein
VTGPCAKRQVLCTIFARSGAVVRGENACATPQPTCPREAGEGYEKCKAVCGQGDHAERDAIAKARAAGIDLRGAHAALTGHYWMCEPCGRALHDAGVVTITVELAQP